MLLYPNTKDAPLGRIVLLVGAYSPAALIIGCRAAPGLGGYVALAVGIAGIVAWAGLIRAWLPRAQPRTVRLEKVDAIDGEVTAYIASYLLPIVAAGSPTVGDWFAYGICAVLILIVGFASNLGSVNPVVYFFGLRVARAEIDGQSIFLLVDRVPPPGQEARVARAVGVALLLRSE